MSPLASSAVVPTSSPSTPSAPLKIMFMSADTGGGHRASSMALAAQFLKLDPSIQYELYDIWTKHGVW